MTGVKDRLVWKRLVNISGKHIYRNDGKPTVYNRICDENINRTIASYVVKMLLIMLSFVGAIIGPYYDFVHNGTLATLYCLKLPYFNEDPYTEFIINVAWQLLTSFFGVIGLFLIEGIITLVDDTIKVSAKLYRHELNELSEQQETEVEIRRRLKMIFMKMLYIDGYDYNFIHLFNIFFFNLI